MAVSCSTRLCEAILNCVSINRHQHSLDLPSHHRGWKTIDFGLTYLVVGKQAVHRKLLLWGLDSTNRVAAKGTQTLLTQILQMVEQPHLVQCVMTLQLK